MPTRAAVDEDVEAGQPNARRVIWPLHSELAVDTVPLNGNGHPLASIPSKSSGKAPELPLKFM